MNALATLPVASVLGGLNWRNVAGAPSPLDAAAEDLGNPFDAIDALDALATSDDDDAAPGHANARITRQSVSTALARMNWSNAPQPEPATTDRSTGRIGDHFNADSFFDDVAW